jgi:hypothetical protein
MLTCILIDIRQSAKQTEGRRVTPGAAAALNTHPSKGQPHPNQLTIDHYLLTTPTLDILQDALVLSATQLAVSSPQHPSYTSYSHSSSSAHPVVDPYTFTEPHLLSIHCLDEGNLHTVLAPMNLGSPVYEHEAKASGHAVGGHRRPPLAASVDGFLSSVQEAFASIRLRCMHQAQQRDTTPAGETPLLSQLALSTPPANAARGGAKPLLKAPGPDTSVSVSTTAHISAIRAIIASAMKFRLEVHQRGSPPPPPHGGFSSASPSLCLSKCSILLVSECVESLKGISMSLNLPNENQAGGADWNPNLKLNSNRPNQRLATGIHLLQLSHQFKLPASSWRLSPSLCHCQLKLPNSPAIRNSTKATVYELSVQEFRQHFMGQLMALLPFPLNEARAISLLLDASSWARPTPETEAQQLQGPLTLSSGRRTPNPSSSTAPTSTSIQKVDEPSDSSSSDSSDSCIAPGPPPEPLDGTLPFPEGDDFTQSVHSKSQKETAGHLDSSTRDMDSLTEMAAHSFHDAVPPAAEDKPHSGAEDTAALQLEGEEEGVEEEVQGAAVETANSVPTLTKTHAIPHQSPAAPTSHTQLPTTSTVNPFVVRHKSIVLCLEWAPAEMVNVQAMRLGVSTAVPPHLCFTGLQIVGCVPRSRALALVGPPAPGSTFLLRCSDTISHPVPIPARACREPAGFYPPQRSLNDSISLTFDPECPDYPEPQANFFQTLLLGLAVQDMNLIIEARSSTEQFPQALFVGEVIYLPSASTSSDRMIPNVSSKPQAGHYQLLLRPCHDLGSLYSLIPIYALVGVAPHSSASPQQQATQPINGSSGRSQHLSTFVSSLLEALPQWNCDSTQRWWDSYNTSTRDLCDQSGDHSVSGAKAHLPLVQRALHPNLSLSEPKPSGAAFDLLPPSNGFRKRGREEGEAVNSTHEANSTLSSMSSLTKSIGVGIGPSHLTAQQHQSQSQPQLQPQTFHRRTPVQMGGKPLSPSLFDDA